MLNTPRNFKLDLSSNNRAFHRTYLKAIFSEFEIRHSANRPSTVLMQLVTIGLEISFNFRFYSFI